MVPMARIRTIKPEFPQSESMGRVSRDARLAFILLWTIADDSGRLRGNSRMLASLLFPYDEDAPKLIDRWLAELEKEGCIQKYQNGSDHYIQIINWTKHQKIDKPSPSKINPPLESSRTESNPRECSSEDQGSRKGSKDQGRDQRIKPTRQKQPSWNQSFPRDVTDAVCDIMDFWPDSKKDIQPKQAPADPTVYVPVTQPGLLAARLAEIQQEGGDMAICVEIAKQYVDGYRKKRNWLKAAQYFFGKVEDAPWKAYYQTEITNREMETHEPDPA